MVYSLTKTDDNTYVFKCETLSEMVTLRTYDNYLFLIAKECVMKFCTIKEMLEFGSNSEEIPLPNVSSKHMICLLKYMILDMEREPIPDIDVEKVQIPEGESAEWWIGKARRQNMRMHATSIPKECWNDDLVFLNRMVKARETSNLERPGGPAEYLNYPNFCFSWGKTMGEEMSKYDVDTLRKKLALYPLEVTRPKMNEYEEDTVDADGNVVMETVTEWRDAYYDNDAVWDGMVPVIVDKVDGKDVIEWKKSDLQKSCSEN